MVSSRDSIANAERYVNARYDLRGLGLLQVDLLIAEEQARLEYLQDGGLAQAGEKEGLVDVDAPFAQRGHDSLVGWGATGCGDRHANAGAVVRVLPSALFVAELQARGSVEQAVERSLFAGDACVLALVVVEDLQAALPIDRLGSVTREDAVEVSSLNSALDAIAMTSFPETSSATQPPPSATAPERNSAEAAYA